jgi:hypothetical protein
MEEWRQITLSGGVLNGAPLLPVYRMTRRFELIQVPESQPWLEVEAPKNAGFLAGPVTIRIHANGGESIPKGTELNVFALPDRLVLNKPVDFGEGTTREISFYPPWPGRYRFDVGNLPTKPVDPLTEVHFDASYLLALGGALLGSLVFGLTVTGRSQALSRRRIALGVLTGLVIAGLALHRSSIPADLPFPSFGQSPYETAMWAGLAGGWFGPGFLMLLIGRLLPAGGQPPPTDNSDHT